MSDELQQYVAQHSSTLVQPCPLCSDLSHSYHLLSTSHLCPNCHQQGEILVGQALQVSLDSPSQASVNQASQERAG